MYFEPITILLGKTSNYGFTLLPLGFDPWWWSPFAWQVHPFAPFLVTFSEVIVIHIVGGSSQCSTIGIGRIGSNGSVNSSRSQLAKHTPQSVPVAWSNWESCYYFQNGMLVRRNGTPMSLVGNLYTWVEIGGVASTCLIQAIKAQVSRPWRAPLNSEAPTTSSLPSSLTPTLPLLMESNGVETNCGIAPTSTILLKNSLRLYSHSFHDIDSLDLPAQNVCFKNLPFLSLSLSLQLAVDPFDVNVHGNSDCYSVEHTHCADEYHLHTSQEGCAPWVWCRSDFMAYSHGRLPILSELNNKEETVIEPFCLFIVYFFCCCWLTYILGSLVWRLLA